MIKIQQEKKMPTILNVQYFTTKFTLLLFFIYFIRSSSNKIAREIK